MSNKHWIWQSATKTAAARIGWGAGLCSCAGGVALATLSPSLVLHTTSVAKRRITSATSNSAMFKDGAKANILYVSDEGNGGNKMWNIDGSPYKPDASSARSGSFSGGKTPGKRYVAVKFEIGGIDPKVLPDEPRYYYVAEYLGGLSWNGFGGGFSAGPQRIFMDPKAAPPSNKADWPKTKMFGKNLESDQVAVYTGQGSFKGEVNVSVPEDWKKADFELGRGFGKFRPIAENIGGRGNLKCSIESRITTAQSAGPDGKQKTINFTESNIRVTLPNSVLRKEWRLLAYDDKGTAFRVPATMIGANPPGRKALETWAVYSDAPENIKRLVLEVRDLQWVKFKRIALYPSAETNQTR